MDFATLWLLDGAASYRISHRAAPYVNEFCHVVAFGAIGSKQVRGLDSRIVL